MRPPIHGASIPATVARLRDLRKRRGMYASEEAADAEIQRVLKLLGPGLHRDVFVRVEIKGEPVKQVAAALGVSERHLYRLRSAMIRRIETALESAQVLPAFSKLDELLETSRQSFELGDAERAKQTLEGLFAHHLTPSHAANAWALQCKIEADRGDPAAAAAALEEARRAAASDDCSMSARTEVGLCESYISFSQGAYDNAIATAADACRDLESREQCVDVRDAVRALLYLATVHQENGTSAQALDALDRARLLMDRLPVEPVRERAQLSILLATTLSAHAEQIDAALAHAKEALLTARWHGLIAEAIWATYTQGYVLLSSGSAAAAAPFAQSALSTARNLVFGHHLARMHLMMTRVLLESGDTRGAIAHMRAAKSAGAHHPRMAAIAAACEMRIQRRLADARTTIEDATRCLEKFGSPNDSYHQGVAYLARADANFRQGVAAMDDGERAVHYLERGGMVCDHVEALELCYRLSKKPRFLKKARELRGRLPQTP